MAITLKPWKQAPNLSFKKMEKFTGFPKLFKFAKVQRWQMFCLALCGLVDSIITIITLGYVISEIRTHFLFSDWLDD
jgi:hypothetical protein